MSITPAGSNVSFDFSSIFNQNKAFSDFQAAGRYADAAFKVRGPSSEADILDLSAEGLAASEAATETDGVSEMGELVDTTIAEKAELTETQRVDIIRSNKNAVLARINTLLAEKGVEVPSDQSFELKTNFMDGSISVTGLEDPELEAAFNEALQGDEELISLMRKTWDGLGMPEQENTQPRNFTIQFLSMNETPADAEIEFTIDMTVNKAVSEDAEAEATEDDENASPSATYQISITLSNKIRADMNAALLDELDNANAPKKSGKKDKSDQTDEIDDDQDVEDTEEIKESEVVALTEEEELEDEEDETLTTQYVFSNYQAA